MIKPLLSIIIPVYNIENYLPACVNSIRNQDFSDYELLLINDGSSDSSGEICDAYAIKDNRVKVFHQENAGVSAARNLGLEKAQGKWICFVDGDDQIEEGSLSKIVEKAENNDPEMLIARSFLYEDGIKKKEKYPFDKTFLNKSFGGFELITVKSYKRGSVCGGVYRKRFLKDNNLKFPLNLWNGEDGIFISLCHLYAKKISFTATDFYLVTEREESASRDWSFERVSKMVDNLSFLNDYIEKQNLSDKQRHILNYTKYGVVSAIFNNLFYTFSIRNYIKTSKAVRHELKEKIDIGEIRINKEKVKFLNLSLSLYSISVLLNQWLRQLSK